MDFSKIKNYCKNTSTIIFVLLTLAFLIRIFPLIYNPIRGWDETVYLNLGQQLSNSFLNYSLLFSGWNDFIPSTDIVYGWPNIGFRAPLLPYVFSLFSFLKLDFLIQFIVPVFSVFSIYLVFLLGEKLFNKNVGLYSALLLSLIPIHVIYSNQTLTDSVVTFFIILSFLSFWEGFERGNKKYKLLFGVFMALSLLTRYTTLWIFPVFLLYFLIRDKSLSFLSDRYLFYTIGFFFLVISPWLFYGSEYYGNIFGAFLHGFKASLYWGGVQTWNFFLVNSWKSFSIVGVISVFSIFFIFLKKEYKNRGIYLLLIWIFFFFFMVTSMPHKEDRFILPIIPAICLISGFFIDQIKSYKNYVMGFVCLVLSLSLYGVYKFEYEKSQNKANVCFSLGYKFLASESIKKESLIITNQSPIVYFYTHKNNTVYIDPWNLESLKNFSKKERNVYAFFSNYDMDIDGVIKKDLEGNFNKIFECSKDWGYSAVYKIR